MNWLDNYHSRVLNEAKDIDISDGGFYKLIINKEIVAIVSCIKHDRLSLYIDYKDNSYLINLEKEFGAKSSAKIEISIPRK